MTKLGRQAISMSILLVLSILFSSRRVAAMTAGNDSRLIAFLGNWQSCPTSEQLDQYTHIAVAFAVSYAYNETKNVCNTNCDIGSPVPVCNNEVNQNLVDSWRASGKKVLLSFGGAGMGGSWAGDVNDCWDYCFNKASHVVSQLVNIVTTQRFDGIDIDYEYFYSTTEQQDFLRDITTGLKASLPVGQNIVTHVPMDSDMVPGSAYYNILKEESASVDFIMPQYYNGITRPAIDGFAGTGSGWLPASSHFANLVNDIYNGEPNKVVFGFCVSDCSATNSNANGTQAAQVMVEVATYYPCNGGAFFWVAERDTGGTWSDEVGTVVHANTGCSGDGSFTKLPVNSIQPPPLPSNCASDTHQCGLDKPCSNGLCCSQWGYCGTTKEYCDTCCQSNCWSDPVTLPLNTPVTSSPTEAPVKVTSPPTKAPVTSSPTGAPFQTTLSPTNAPVKVTSSPTNAPVTSSQTGAPFQTTMSPTRAPVKVTLSPTKAPPDDVEERECDDSPNKYWYAGPGRYCSQLTSKDCIVIFWKSKCPKTCNNC